MRPCVRARCDASRAAGVSAAIERHAARRRYTSRPEWIEGCTLRQLSRDGALFAVSLLPSLLTPLKVASAEWPPNFLVRWTDSDLIVAPTVGVSGNEMEGSWADMRPGRRRFLNVGKPFVHDNAFSIGAPDDLLGVSSVRLKCCPQELALGMRLEIWTTL